MTYCVYKITNPTNKIYIGVTNNFKRRMFEHKSDAKVYELNWALHNSIRKYGFENHICEILHNELTKDDAYKLEKKLIIQFL
jgi:group I intron endonuclease